MLYVCVFMYSPVLPQHINQLQTDVLCDEGFTLSTCKLYSAMYIRYLHIK